MMKALFFFGAVAGLLTACGPTADQTNDEPVAEQADTVHQEEAEKESLEAKKIWPEYRLGKPALTLKSNIALKETSMKAPNDLVKRMVILSSNTGSLDLDVNAAFAEYSDEVAYDIEMGTDNALNKLRKNPKFETVTVRSDSLFAINDNISGLRTRVRITTQGQEGFEGLLLNYGTLEKSWQVVILYQVTPENQSWVKDFEKQVTFTEGE